MMPVYIDRDSWPHQRNQTGNHQTFPAYIPMSPSKPQMVYEPWPHSGNYGYPNPMPCNSCCNHGSLPCFHGFRPSYPQPMPSPVHYCRGYPAPYYPDPYPVYRVPPPPHYTAEMPRYEYDKNVPWNQNYHCCGCPNHQRGDGGVKIEEQEPDVVETKRNKPFVPIHMKGCPHPIVWIPEEYAKEQRRPSEEEEKKPESISQRMNQAECVNPREQEPSIWNSWFPLDRDEIKYLMNNGEKMKTQDQKNEDQKKEYPCPVIWMPSYDHRWEESGKKENKGVNVNGDQDQQNEDQIRQFPIPLIWMHPEDIKPNEGGDKDMNASPKLGENSPYVFKFAPMKHLGGDNSSENSNLSEEIIVGKDGTEVNEKTAARKVISVKQIDQPKAEEKKLKENEKHNETSKPSGTDSNRQSSLLPKSSKLPPVCLRVDSLPKKKNGNGTSRSPSPPRSKGCSRQNSNGTSGASTESALLDSKASTLSNKEVEPKRRDTAEIVVTERTSHEPAVSVHSSGHTNAVVSENQTASEMAEERKLDKKTLPDVDVEPKKTSDDPKVSVHSAVHTNTKISEKQTVEKAGKDDDECQTRDEMAETEKATDSSKSGDKNKPEKKILLDVDAALRIQSAYRGFEVRRSQPLKKLKQIAEVRDQVVDVRNHIQAMDSSSGVQENHKQKLVIGETIMRLLLKLDTIQGLHPSLRDIRKSLAKELVTLQEKLDSLVFEPEKGELEACPVGPVEEAEAEIVECNQEMEGCPVGPVEEVAEAETVECKQEKQEETESDGSSDDARKSARDEVESGQDQLLPATDSEQSFKGEETSFCFSDDTVVHVVKGDDQEVQVDGDMKTEEPYLEHVVKGEDQEVQMEGDMRTEEPNLEATIEDRDEARTSSATKLVETVQGDKPPELEQAGEVSLQEDSNSNSDMPANSLEDTDVTCLHQNMETSIVGLSEEDIGDECVETKKDIEQVEMANGKEVESLAALEVSSPCEIEEAMAAEKEAKMKEVMATEKQAEIHELAELPIGAIDEDGLVDKENKCLKTTDTTLPESTTTNETEKPEAALEEKPIAKVKEEAKAGYEEKVDQCSISFETEESQPPISFEEEGSQNVLCEGEFVSENMETTKEVPIEKKEEADEHLQQVATEEAKEETQEMKVHVTDEKTNNKPNGPEITDDNVTDREKFTLLLAEQEGESLPLSPTCSQMSNDKSETGSKTNERLMQENEKLREMMEKLIEAGKQQLNVISDLNGRVKDLEKKLSKRNKKLRTRCGASRGKRPKCDCC